jgi:hypothetical protein
MNRFRRNQTGIDNELNKWREFMPYDSSMAAIKQRQPPPVHQPQQPQPVHQPLAATTPVHQPQLSQQYQPQNENVFTALNQDPLFWCLYIMMHGAFKYEQLANRFTA